MTQLLQHAIGEIQKLPDSEQDAIAAIILSEIADEQRWQESFANSQEVLSGLAAKARRDIREGKTRKLGID